MLDENEDEEDSFVDESRELLDRDNLAAEELEMFRNGYKGGCYACETVAEKNIELEQQLTELREAVGKMANAYANVKLFETMPAKEAFEAKVKEVIIVFKQGGE